MTKIRAMLLPFNRLCVDTGQRNHFEMVTGPFRDRHGTVPGPFEPVGTVPGRVGIEKMRFLRFLTRNLRTNVLF